MSKVMHIVPETNHTAVLTAAMLHGCATASRQRPQTAVDDCLERVLGPDATPASTFAVVFFEGHDHAGVQGALDSFAER